MTTVPISIPNCGVLCNPSMVKKNGNRCNFPSKQATQTQRPSPFSMAPMAPTFFPDRSKRGAGRATLKTRSKVASGWLVWLDSRFFLPWTVMNADPSWPPKARITIVVKRQLLRINSPNSVYNIGGIHSITAWSIWQANKRNSCFMLTNNHDCEAFHD